jgi:hypothetical protein
MAFAKNGRGEFAFGTCCGDRELNSHRLDGDAWATTVGLKAGTSGTN